MKNNLITTVLLAVIAFASCGKSGSSEPPPVGPIDPNAGVTNGNTTDYKGYVVKTVGINMVMVGVDKNYKLTNAYLYGGGNKIILKAGTGNKAELVNAGLATCPDAVTDRPDGTVNYTKTQIDNGKMLDTAGGAAVLKLKGFDKSKTGYNQLNIVLCDFLWPSYLTNGYYNNVIFTKFEKQTGKKNADYGGGAFISSVFGGNIKVSSVELAPPVSDKTYIVEDQILFGGVGRYFQKEDRGNGADMTSPFFSFISSTSSGLGNTEIATNLTSEWVNADNATLIAVGNDYIVNFANIKSGDTDMVIDPADTTSKVFLRVKGFDRKVFGFNALRIFVGKQPNSYNDLIVYASHTTGAKITLNELKKAYSVQGLNVLRASPIWPHY